ncbi:neuroblast differentiation-associated protein AHNAK-like isoform X1 [Channa argus]|uniref:neuroblast differentiation-associated protein AHNAK-like isoform X1 n=1 Tax=Channa argus TaxID=215402 RepID=UPI0035225E3E
MCDCFHLAFPNWQAASSGTGAGRRLRAPDPATEEESICDEPSQFTEGERPRPQGSSPIEEYPETEKYIDSDEEFEAEHDPHHKSGSGKKNKKSGLGSMFEKRSTPKMSKVKEMHSLESGVIVKTAKDGCAEGLVYGGGGKEGIFIKEVVPESPASKNLKLQEGDQILSATVYFDNMSYEDAIKILEHARAYKVKLCLKRKSHITETEPAIECEAIPEEELYAPEMREQGTTKRRGDARISWPKFPSLGRKARFTRSHSSSEADEQRKLELSPTTSDTESPVKAQDALKGKKRHKMKLSILTNRGRISSSEDQDTEAPTSGQISSDIHQTVSEMLSPEGLESPSGETLQVYMTEEQKVVDKKQKEPETVQHKVELISIDSTLKTADLTAALMGEESLSGTKSPGEKKVKKERSELKVKILGKDKSHKKDAKAKSSPKRLKTLGASFEIADQPENKEADVFSSLESDIGLKEDHFGENSGAFSKKSVTRQMEMSVPKVEFDISDVTFICKSPKNGEEKARKDKGIKQKQDTKIFSTFKLPKVGLSDTATEEPIQNINENAEECSTKIEHPGTEGTVVKEDPFDRLSKSSHSRTQLPKREDIVIPGMEDMSRRTKAKKVKEPKTVFTGNYDKIQAETVQMSIDVDSVKEAVSKLPGFKLPKVDTSGVPIPEEITVIDANAQRISVKTPTKVADTKTKHETQLTKLDMTASPQISKTTVKLPKITLADLNAEGLLSETRVDLEKHEKEYKTKQKQSDKEIKTEVDKREDIIIPGKESARDAAILKAQEIERTQDSKGIRYENEVAATSSHSESDKKSMKAKVKMPTLGIVKPDIKIPDIGIYLPHQTISEQKDDTVKGERTIFLQEVKITKTESMKNKGQIREVLSDVKIPEIDNIEYIDSVGGSTTKTDGGIRITSTDMAKPMADTSFEGFEAKEPTIKLPKCRAVTPDMAVNVPDANINTDTAEMKPLERQRNLGITMSKESESEELDGQESKLKMPNIGIKMSKLKGPKFDLSFSKTDADVTVPEAEDKVEFPEGPEAGNIDVSVQVQKMAAEKPELEIKPLQTEVELDGQRSKIKIPKLGITMSKVKVPEIDVSLSKKDVDVKLPDAVSASNVSVDLQDLQSTGTSKATVIVPEAGKDLKGDGADITLPREWPMIDSEAPIMDVEGTSIDVKMPESQGEHDRLGKKFKMPSLGKKMPTLKGPEIHFDISKKERDVTLPEAEAKVNVPDVEFKEHSANVEVNAPEIKVTAKAKDGSPSKFKLPTLKLPKFGTDTKVEAPHMDKSIKIDGSDIHIPEEESAVNMASPSLDIEGPTIDLKTSGTEQDGKGRKFKMPHFGLSMPQMKGPKMGLKLSNKDVEIQLPEYEIGVNLPEAPKIAVAMEPLECDAEMDGNIGMFEIPKSQVKLPKVKGPEIDLDLSKKDIDVKLSKVEADVKLPDVDVSIPEAKIHVQVPEEKAPEMDLNLLKKDIDVTLPQTKVKTKLPDVSLGKARSLKPEANVEIKKPEVQIKPFQTDAELKAKEDKIKMSKFEITMPKLKGPDIDLSLSKKDVDVKLPEAKDGFKLPEAHQVNLGKVDVSMPQAEVEVTKPELEYKPVQVESDLDGQRRKFKMRKFGISMPKGPEIDFSLSKKDVDVSLPKAKAEVSVPEEPSAEVEIVAPKIESQNTTTKGSRSKYKLPSLKFPTFGAATPAVSAKVAGVDKDIKIDGAEITIPEEVLSVRMAEPSIEGPSVEMKTTRTEHDGKGGKFKLPSLGFSASKVKGHDIDVTLPEATVDVKLPDVEVKQPSALVEVKEPEVTVVRKDKEGSPSKFKMPTFKLPKFGVATPSATAEISDMDKDIKIDGAEITIPEEVLSVRMAEPSIEGPSVEIKTTGTDHDGKGGKFKLPSLGFSASKVKGHDIDVTLPEASADVKLPDVEVKQPSALVEVKEPEVTVVRKDKEGSPSKFKMPTFKLPKFGFATPSATAEISDMDKDIKIDGAEITIPEEVLSVRMAEPSIEGPSVEMKTTRTEHDGKGGKFKLPSLGFSASKVKGHDIDVTLPEASADVKLPDVEVKQPSALVEVKEPEVTVVRKDKEGSPSKFKMPTFKLPKFGVATPSATAEISDMDKDIKIDGAEITIPEEVLSVRMAEPSIEGPSVEMKTTGTDHDGKGGKFKLPSLGFSASKVKGHDIDVTLPEATVDVKLPDVEVKQPSALVEVKEPEVTVVRKDKEGSPSKFKMPTFKLPKFGVATPSATAEISDMDKDIKIDGAEITIPEEVLSVRMAEPSIEGPSVEMKTTRTDHDGKGGRFEMSKFEITMPKLKGPDIDLSLSKKDVDVKLPEAKDGFKLPEAHQVNLGKVDVSMPQAEVEVTKPELEYKPVQVESDLDGQRSKFKMRKFGISMPKGPEIDFSLSKKDVDVSLPKAKAEVSVPEEPSAEVEIVAPKIESQNTTTKGSPSKYKLPSLKFPTFGAATPAVSAKVAGVDKDIKIDDADMHISTSHHVDAPEVKMEMTAEVKPFDVEVKQPSPLAEIKGPEVTVVRKDKEGSPSKFKMPTFKLPKFGVATPSATAEISDMDKDIKIDGAEITIPEEVLSVRMAEPSIEGPSVEIKTTGTDHDGKGGKFKLPSLGFSASKVKGHDIDVTLPEASADVKLPDVEVKQPSALVEVKEPEVTVVRKDKEGSPSKFKMPTFKLPKFGVATPSATAEISDMDKDIKIDGAEITIPEEVLSVRMAEPSIEGPSVEMKTTGTDHDGKGGKFKLPSLGFSASKVKGHDIDVTLPEATVDVKLPDVEVKQPSALVEVKEPEVTVVRKDKEGSPSKFKMPTFKLPKFGVATPSATAEISDMDKDIKIDGAEITIPEEVLSVRMAEPSIEGPSVEMKTTGTDHDGKGGKFKLPSLGFSASKVKGHDIDGTLPEATYQVELPDAELKKPSAEAEFETHAMDFQRSNVEGSPSKFQLPTFKFPKFGTATAQVSVGEPDMDKDIKHYEAKLKIPKEEALVDITPSIDTKELSVDLKAKGSEFEGSGDKLKMPKIDISLSKNKGPETDLSLSKIDPSVKIPEAKADIALLSAEVKEPEVAVAEHKAPMVEDEDKSKRLNWTFPKFSFSRSGGKTPDTDVNLETPKVDVALPETNAEVYLPDAEVKGSSGGISLEKQPAAKPDVNLKKNKFSLPTFSFSKSSVKEPEGSTECPHVDVSIQDGDILVQQPEMEIEAPELKVQHDGQKSKFKLPKLSVALTKSKGPEVDLNVPQKDVEVKLPEGEVKESSAISEMNVSETEAKSKDSGGSPLKFKMPTLKMPLFGSASYDVTITAPDADKAEAETDGAKLKENVTVNIKDQSTDIKPDVSKAAVLDSETPKSESDGASHGSPSKFKLPLFKMPKLSFSKTKPEDENSPVTAESKEAQLEMEVESKSPKFTLGEILNYIDVEFDVPKADKDEETLETSKDIHKTDEPNGKPLEAEKKESDTKQDSTKGSEKKSWFQFPKFGLSSPSEPIKVPDEDKHKDGKSTVGEICVEESPTCSIQSSDAFADISSTMTSEHIVLSSSSPTKVTVKYCDPNAAAGLGELHSNIITSTTRTETISVEPNLPEKITIPSSGASSSSEDNTLRLQSGKIHVITSNIQATPEAHHVKLLTAVQVQSAESLPHESEAGAWTVDEQSGRRTVIEKHLIRETSSERGDTIVITKQVTRTFDSSEPISGETATSIRRLRDSVHSEKMKFFDGTEK